MIKEVDFYITSSVLFNLLLQSGFNTFFLLYFTEVYTLYYILLCDFFTTTHIFQDRFNAETNFALPF